MTQIQYHWERKLGFVSATAETYSTDEFCHVTQRLWPRENWVRRLDFSSCLCYCPAVWSWVSHFTAPGNKVLLWWILLGNSLEINKRVEELVSIFRWVPGQGERNSILLQGLHRRWVVRKNEVETDALVDVVDIKVPKKGLTKWGLAPVAHTHTHIHTHWECRASGLPAGWTSKTCLITESPRMWPAFHASRFKSFTTSVIPHVQEPWIRASEVVSLTSTFQSFQSMPLHTLFFLNEHPDYFPYPIDSRSWNWWSVCKGTEWGRVWPPSVFLLEKTFSADLQFCSGPHLLHKGNNCYLTEDSE